MKTVSGKIVSTKPVNLSKAANILSNFVTFDNGASQSVSAYLRRASVAFNELVYFKKHHKLEKDCSKEEALTKSDMSRRRVKEDEVRVPENGELNMNFDQEAVENNENGTRKVEGKLRKKEKKKKKDGSLGSEINDNTEVDFEQGNENVKEKSEEKKKKKKKDGSLGGGKSDNTEVNFEQGNENVKEKSEDKKKKKDGSLGSGKNDNTEVGFEQGNESVKEKSEEKKKKNKKRKNSEVDTGETCNSVAPV